MASPSQLEALAVLGQLALLAVAISIGHFLKRKQVLWIGGAGAALLLGVLVGVLVRLARTAPLVASWMVFQSEFFFLVLLPPIMFDACFNLDSRLFVKNIGSVCALAFAGTTISTFAMGLNMWVAGKLKLCLGLSFLKALTFGALISATDPVTVLAIFNALGANPDLYMNVFGESVLNDAVAMVLYQTFSAFASREVPVTAANIAKGVGSFFGIFLGSTTLGIVIGLLLAALLRTRWYHGDVNLETGLMLLFGYGSYMAGTAAGLSGIVCVMFCAMVCGGYAAPNLSPGGLQASKGVFAVLASCMEQFVFVYIGISLFMEPQEWHCIAFTAASLFGLAWSRAANVLPCCAAINYLRPASSRMHKKHQFMLWWSGLRGAMAFALSVEAMKTFGEAGKVMMTCTFMVILITVLVNGGSTGYLLAWCDLVHRQNSTAGDKSAALGSFSAAHEDQEGQELEQMQLLLHDKLAGKAAERDRRKQGPEGFLPVADGLKNPAQTATSALAISAYAEDETAQQFREYDAVTVGQGVASPAVLVGDNQGGGLVPAMSATNVTQRCSRTGAMADSSGALPEAGALTDTAAALQANASSAAEKAQPRCQPAQSYGTAVCTTGDGLQEHLDRWGTALLIGLFVNPISAQEHVEWQQLQEQVQHENHAPH